MSEHRDTPRRPLVIGVNHRTADGGLRDRLLIHADVLGEFSAALLEAPAIDETVVLSTCNRTEIHAIVLEDDAAAQAIIAAWQTHSGVPAAEIEAHCFRHADLDAARHLLRVTASLDSLVVGESQVFGQVKEAFDAARRHSSAAFYLNHIFRMAIRTAKRVYSETGINEGAVSISYAAVELARKVLGDLAEARVGVIGSGEMGALASAHLRKAGAQNFIFFNRSRGAADALAANFDGDVCLLADLEGRLHECDVVVSATGSSTTVLGPEAVELAVKARRGKPLFLIDIAAPADIDPAVAELPNVFLFTIDDLSQVVRENTEAREVAAHAAMEIIDGAVGELGAWLQGLEIRPVIRKLRLKYERVVEGELERLSRDLSDEERKKMAYLGHALLNKFLHDPLTRLKAIGEQGNGRMAGYYADAIFNLGDTDTDADAEEG